VEGEPIIMSNIIMARERTESPAGVEFPIRGGIVS
jgi:hypothetical protein